MCTRQHEHVAVVRTSLLKTAARIIPCVLSAVDRCTYRSPTDNADASSNASGSHGDAAQSAACNSNVRLTILAARHAIRAPHPMLSVIKGDSHG